MRRSEDEEGQDYAEVSPEIGWWRYVICVGVTVIFIASTVHKAVFGLIYNDFLDELGAGTGVVTIVFGVFEVAVDLAGFLSTIFLKKMSVRQVALLGAMVYILASIFAVFVTSTIELVIINGFLHGFGLGIISSASYTSVNNYIRKKRVLYLGLCKTCLAMSLVVYSLVAKVWINEYGFRGTLVILCGISLNSILGALTLHPVKWHILKKHQLPEENEFLQKNKSIKEQKKYSKQNNKSIRSPSLPTLPDREELLAKPAFNRKYSKDKVDLENSLKPSFVEEGIKNKDGIWQTIINLLDLTLLEDLVFVNIVIGIALTFFTNKTFFVLEPLYLSKLNLAEDEVSYIVAVGFVTDMLVRFLFSLSAIVLDINSRFVFYFAALLQIIFKIAITQFTTYMPLLILTAILGALKSLVFITQPIVIAEYVPIEKFPAAMGFYWLLDSIISVTIGPLIGFMRDYTDSYTVAYVMLAVCNMCCVVPWTIEAVLKMRKRRIDKRICN